MALGFRSRLKAAIEEDYRFLVRMLGEYPHYINTIKQEQSAKAEDAVRENSQESDEVLSTIYESCMAGYYEHDEVISYFYNAMALSIYSFYERYVHELAKTSGITSADPGIRDIKTKLKITLSTVGQSISDELYKEFRILRNYIAHNNYGAGGMNAVSKKDESSLKKIIGREPEIHFTGSAIYIEGPKYLSSILDKAYKLLCEVAVYLGGYSGQMRTENGIFAHLFSDIHIGGYEVCSYKISQDDDGLVFTLSKEGKKEQRVVNYRLDGLGHPDITATICSFFIALNQGL